jgi:hypothetical protein
MDNQNKIAQRITVFWLIVLSGLTSHIIFHLVPVFYGIDITKANANGTIPVFMLLTFGLSFFIPVFAVVNVQYFHTTRVKVLNLILGSLALLVNTAHLAEIFLTKAKEPLQLFVLLPLFLVAILLFRDSVRWLKM